MKKQCKDAPFPDTWLTEQVNQAFDKVSSSEASFIEHHIAKSIMSERKTKIRVLHQKQKFPI